MPASTLPRDWSSPATSVVAVTPNDGADLPLWPCRWLWCTVAGNLSFIALDDSSPVTIPVAVGKLEFAVKRVRATGTTATVVACY